MVDIVNEEQQQRIKDAEAELGLGPSALAAEMGVSYQTLKDWKSGRRKMQPVAFRCLELVTEFYAHAPAAR